MKQGCQVHHIVKEPVVQGLMIPIRPMVKDALQLLFVRPSRVFKGLRVCARVPHTSEGGETNARVRGQRGHRLTRGPRHEPG